VAAPQGGQIISVVSDTPVVVAGPLQTLSPWTGTIIGPPLMAGTATMTITWQDATGAQQTTTLPITAT
jgi:hypothetical protein